MVPGRYEAGLTYNPAMRTGAYRGGAAQRNALADVYADVPRDASFAPVAGRNAMAPAMAPAAAPTLAGGTGALSGAAPAYGMDGAGSSAQGEYGGPGPEGKSGSGNFGQDARNAADAFGPAALGMAFGGPAGIAGVVGGALGYGALSAIGANRAANALAEATFGAPSYSRGRGDEENVSTDATEQGGVKGGTFGDVSAENPADSGMDAGKDFGGATAGADVAGTSNENTGAGAGSEDGGSKGDTSGDVGADSPAFRDGGYTGDDGDGELEPMDATLHEGEFVIRPEAVRMYGRNFLQAVNEGRAPVNAMAGMMGNRRPMHSANNLLQMMRR